MHYSLVNGVWGGGGRGETLQLFTSEWCLGTPMGHSSLVVIH